MTYLFHSSISRLCTLLLALLMWSCGDDDSTSLPGTSGGAGGSAGQGGQSALGGSSGGHSDGGSGGTVAAGPSLNGCTDAMYIDGSAVDATREVKSTGALTYESRCLRIAKGQAVTFVIDGPAHPTRSGKVSGTLEGSANNPIPRIEGQTASGGAGGITNTRIVTVSFPEEGNFPYYCIEHGPTMAGVTRVGNP